MAMQVVEACLDASFLAEFILVNFFKLIEFFECVSSPVMLQGESSID